MANKDTLEVKIDALTLLVEKGFGAVADDVAHIKQTMTTKADLEKLATKEQLSAVQMQVNSIENQLRQARTEIRLGDLEEKVFGELRR
jgi:hypothetical protein